jgi:hypothetical protein
MRAPMRKSATVPEWLRVCTLPPIMRKLALLSLAVLSFAGCAASTDDDGANSANAVSSEASIDFDAAGFKVETSGKLAAGQRVRIQYDLARLPTCRGNVNGGGPGWNISGFASFNGKPATAFEVTKLTADGRDRESAPYELLLPEGGDLALWFSVSSAWGCNQYDSQYGQNFHFDVAGPSPEANTTLTFRADGSLDQSGPLKAGATVAVRYEQDRLQTCRQSFNGYASWSITGHARINGGNEQKFATARPMDARGEKRELIDNLVQLAEPGELELWFENNDMQCVGWDSMGGKNYRFTIEP